MPSLSYPWPSPRDTRETPTWVGDGFQVGQRLVRVLQYGANHDGWDDGLTSLHEESAGADHAMDRASRAHALSQLVAHVSPSGVILEVGCSSGYLLEDLAPRFRSGLLIGADSTSGLTLVANRLPGVPLLQFDLTECPLPDASVDAVVALNVLEHIADDRAAMAQIARILRPGGVAILEVPAGPRLYDWYDATLRHYRRYSMRGLKQLAGRAGLRTVRASHLGVFVYPMFAFLKMSRRMVSGTSTNVPAVTQSVGRTRRSRALAAGLAFELALGRLIRYPFGIRCLLTCQKASR